MNAIHEEMNVMSDALSARGYLRAFFDEQKHRESDCLILPLQADIRVRDFLLRTSNRQHANVNAIFDLDWEVETDGPFPHFCGTLSVRQSGDGACLIALDGGYLAPFGTAGRIFDTMFGHAIARSTVRNLLRRLCAFIEERRVQAHHFHANVQLAS